MIEVAGVHVSRELVLGIAQDLLRQGSEDTARLLLNAVQLGKPRVALSIAQREEVLRHLGDPPAGLEQLRAVCWRSTLAASATGSPSADLFAESGR